MRSKTDRKICGTCEYWTGNRVPVFDSKGTPKVDILDLYGLCENQNSKFKETSRINKYNCKYHSKWTELL